MFKPTSSGFELPNPSMLMEGEEVHYTVELSILEFIIMHYCDSEISEEIIQSKFIHIKLASVLCYYENLKIIYFDLITTRGEDRYIATCQLFASACLSKLATRLI